MAVLPARPMRRQALSFQISFCAIWQVVGKGELACRKFLKIAGQTSVERIASTKDHSGTRIECCNGAELEDVVGHFIDYTFGTAIEGFQVLEVRVTEAPNRNSMVRARLGRIFLGAASDRGNYGGESLCKIADFPKFPRAEHA